MHWELQQCEGALQLREIFTGTGYIYLIVDYQPNGTLLHQILEKQSLPEEQTKLIIAQLLLTIDFIHQKMIVHRDLKIENILINKDENGDLHVKIADFGLATFLPQEPLEKLFLMCGTPGYIAPEILNNEGYREKADVFSIGSIMFNLVSGMNLFSGENTAETLE